MVAHQRALLAYFTDTARVGREGPAFVDET